MQNTTCSVKAEWTSYSESAESHYLKNTELVESGKKEMKDVIHKWLASLTLQNLFQSEKIQFLII